MGAVKHVATFAVITTLAGVSTIASTALLAVYVDVESAEYTMGTFDLVTPTDDIAGIVYTLEVAGKSQHACVVLGDVDEEDYDFQELPSWVLSVADRHSSNLIHQGDALIVQASGWPLPAAYSAVCLPGRELVAGYLIDDTVDDFGSHEALPTRMIMTGAVCDMFAWSAFWAVLYFSFRSGRRLFWSRRGRCTHCGYDLRDLQSHRCPECGRLIGPRDRRSI